MGKIRIVDIQQNSPEWAAWRLGVIGASSAAAVLGECKYMTPYELWLEKTGRKQGFAGNSATERGSEMEASARAAYEIHRGFVEAKPTCVLHPDIDYIGASLDGLEPDFVIFESKYPSEASHQLAVGGEVPRHYWIQCQHQLMCVPDAPYLNYWSYRPEGPALVRVDHDKEFQAMLLKALVAFWELVKADIPPPLTERDAKVIESGPIEEMCQRLVTLKDDKSKDGKAQADLLKQKIIEMGGHNKIRCGKVLVSKTVTASGKDSYRLTVAKEQSDAGGQE